MTDSVGHLWAAVIRDGADPSDVDGIIAAINRLTAAQHANRGAVIVACAYLLGQNIVGANAADSASEMRAGIMALIDAYAMEVAAVTCP